MKKFILKKRNKFLYLGYKERKVLSEQGMLTGDKPQYNVKRVLQREKKLSKIPISKTTKTIAIACLENECGCTYITHALANYIKTTVTNKVYIIDMNGKDDKNYKANFKLKDICKQYNDYRYVLIDMGNLNERKDADRSEYKRAGIKIMIANIEENYLRQLAAYIKEDKKSSVNYAYIFNLVPQEKKRTVHRLMEAYEHYCIPIMNKDNPNYETQLIFHNILRRKRKKDSGEK